MEQASESAAVDPPAYTPTVPAPPTTTRRTIEDTRALILANASMIKPRARGDEPIELVIGKTKSAAELAAAATPNTRTFTSTRSNVTIRINDTVPGASNSGDTPERRPSENAGARAVGRHYAVLLYRVGFNGMNMVLKGEPQDTVEEALECMLDKTEIAVSDILSKRWPEIDKQ